MERGREPPDAEGEDVVAPDAGVGDALAVLIGDDEAREDRLLHRGARRAAARRGGVRRDGVAGVGGKGGVIALRVVTGDGAALSKAGELLLDAVSADGHVVFSGGGRNGHFALEGDVGICIAFAASTDAGAANNDFFPFICTAADRIDGGTAVLIALDGDLIAIVIAVVFSASTAAYGRAACASGNVDLGVALDGHIAETKNTTTDACAISAALHIVDFGIILDDHVTVADFIGGTKCAAADACRTVAAGRILDFCIAGDGHIAIAAIAAANACTVLRVRCIFNNSVAGYRNGRTVIITTADARSAITACGSDGAAADGHIAAAVAAAADASA